MTRSDGTAIRKVAIFLTTNPETGGEHQYAVTLAKCLKRLSGTRFEFIAICTNPFWRIWCRSNDIKCFSVDNITLKGMKWNYRFPNLCKLYNGEKTELGRIIKREKIDVLFISTQCYFLSLDTIVIAPVHDLMHRYESIFPEVRDGYEFREKMFKCEARNADYILVDSILGKQQFIDSYGEYMRRKKPQIVSLPFVVSPHILKIDEEYISVPDKYVFYPAQFWKHKNHINLIKAIQLLSDSVSDIHLVLVGSEKNCLREIQKYIRDNKLQNHITILGFVSDGNLKYLYKHAAAMVMPSYFGPTNIPPLEAMAIGCPVAVANKYAMPEQVGDAGLFFNPDSPKEIAECIRKIWTDDELRQSMIEKGYQRSNNWTRKHFQHRVSKILDNCFAKKYKR